MIIATLTFGVIVVAVAAATPAVAQARTEPLLCAMTTILECDAKNACTRRTAESADLPTIVVVDASNRIVTGLGSDRRRTRITSAMQVDGKLIVQGGEAGRGWSATIAERTGAMAVAVVDDEVTFSIFGSCVVSP